jgi:hypothetical protein
VPTGMRAHPLWGHYWRTVDGRMHVITQLHIISSFLSILIKCVVLGTPSPSSVSSSSMLCLYGTSYNTSLNLLVVKMAIVTFFALAMHSGVCKGVICHVQA